MSHRESRRRRYSRKTSEKTESLFFLNYTVINYRGFIQKLVELQNDISYHGGTPKVLHTSNQLPFKGMIIMKVQLQKLFPKAALSLAVLVAASSPLQASEGVILKSTDLVGISFWFISMALVASTVFFLMESLRMTGKWKTSVVVSGLVTLVAATHYFYMREVWVATGTTPTVYRYIDWIITVPLLMVEFYLILSAITKVPGGVFWRLIIGTIAMLAFGFAGEAGLLAAWTAFVLSMLGWIFIIYEVFAGEASKISASKASPSVRSAFNTMRWIVTLGWAIYPLGYVLGYLVGNGPASSSSMLNLIYNLADVVNKIGFGLIIWSVASREADNNSGFKA